MIRFTIIRRLRAESKKLSGALMSGLADKLHGTSQRVSRSGLPADGVSSSANASACWRTGRATSGRTACSTARLSEKPSRNRFQSTPRGAPIILSGRFVRRLPAANALGCEHQPNPGLERAPGDLLRFL